jgi:hypothetical protein
MALLGVLGLLTVMSKGFPFRVPEAVRSLPDPRPDLDIDYRNHTCFLGDPDEDQTAFHPECNDRSRRPLVLLWGDSHAAAAYPGLRNLLKSIPFGLSQFNASGCQPLLLHVQFNRLYCKNINDVVFEQVRQTQPDIVILASRRDYDNSKFDYTIAQLKSIGIKRIVVLGPLPRWAPAACPTTSSIIITRIWRTC